MTHIERLFKQCEPVQEDTPVPAREHRVTVDRRDLLRLIGDLQAAQDHLDAVLFKGRKP